MSAKAIGEVCGIILVCVCVTLALILITKKDGSIKCRFDERQEIVRGRGYKYAFFTMMICMAVFACLNESADLEQHIEGSLEMVIAICAGVAVYASYCIWHEGYFALNENQGRLLIVFIILGVMNVVLGGMAWREGRCFENGVLTINFSNAVCGVLSLWVSVMVALKWMRDRKEDE